MEIRCTQCSHVGPAGEVRPTPGGVALVCENCGHPNPLDLDDRPTSPGAGQAPHDETEEAGAEAAAKAAAPRPTPAQPAQRPGHIGEPWLRADALDKLMPQPGAGPRCPKCVRLVEPGADHCSHCGLGLDEAASYAAGQAPWEAPPAGKEAAAEQAELLWQSYQEAPSHERLDNFVDLVRGEDLLDLGIRKLRWHLVDHPDDAHARAQLRDLGESLQSRLIVAQVQAQADAEEFRGEVDRAKRSIIYAALAFWGGIFLLFLVLFWDKCGRF